MAQRKDPSAGASPAPQRRSQKRARAEREAAAAAPASPPRRRDKPVFTASPDQSGDTGAAQPAAPVRSSNTPPQHLPMGMRRPLVDRAAVAAMSDSELTPSERRQRGVFGDIRHGIEGTEVETPGVGSMNVDVREALAAHQHAIRMDELMRMNIPIHQRGVERWPDRLTRPSQLPRPNSGMTSRFDPSILRVTVTPGDKKAKTAAETRMPTAEEVETARNAYHASKDKQAKK